MAQKEGDIIMKEIEKIIDSNKLKASNLRNTLLDLNQNVYTNELHFQIIQFLGEFEYDLKTLFELFIDFKSKIEFNFQNNMNSIFSEINSLKKENLELKEKNKNKNSEDNNHFYNTYKPRISKSNKNLSTALNTPNNAININKNNNNSKAINKTTSLYLHLKNPNVKKKLKEIIKNKNKDKSCSNNLNRTNNSERRAYIRYNNSSQKNEEKLEKENLPLHPYQRKQNTNSEMNFYLNKSNTSNNINRRKFFYDYDTYLTNLKKSSLYNTNINLIKYDNYMQNKNNTFNNNNKPDLKKIARGKISLDKEKKRKIIFQIFQDEKLLNELKKQFGTDIENKLLNEDIDFKFFQKVEEIADKIRKKIYYTPKIKSNDFNIDEMKENISYNFKIPKRFSN